MADNINNNNNNMISDADQRKNERQSSNKRIADDTFSILADDSFSAVGTSSASSSGRTVPSHDNSAPRPPKPEAPVSTDAIGASGTEKSSRLGKYSSGSNAAPYTGSVNDHEESPKRKPLMASTRKKMAEAAEQAEIMAEKLARKTKRKQKRHRRHSIFKILLYILLLAVVIGCTACGIMAISVITHAEKIDADNIYASLSQNSIMYDCNGDTIENVMSSELRTNLDYSEMPSTLLSSFIAIEDKTFWHHNGFNFVRIAGAIVESVTSGGDISGTSTLTQQLARNIFLSDIKSERTIKRKMTEAYYTMILERHLDKNQIIEAYLNTIYLGFNAYGVEAAAETYFGKTATELNLAECSALACIPKNPTRYALIKRYYSNEVDSNSTNIIAIQGEYVLVYNDAFKDRQKLVLNSMVNEGYITQQQADEAYAYDLKDSINPPETLDGNSQSSSYYTDYVKDEAVDILMEEMNLSETDATSTLYSGGLSIYTALDPEKQQIVEEAFSNNANFPSARSQRKDSSGNMINSKGAVMVYNYENYYNADGSFTLQPGEFMYQADGSLCLYKGKRLSFYSSKTDGKVTNITISFRPTYVYEDGLLHISSSGQISIGSEYKKRDNDGNVVISKEYLDANPGAFNYNGSTVTVSSDISSINEKVVQPQGSMVIMDQTTGCIVAMVGGRNITGSKLYNRANSPRQPGSSIKPLAVYTPAILKGYTGATIIADSPNYVNGKLWPKNSYNGYKGNVTMRQAVQSSINVVAVRVLEGVGIDNSFNFVESLGITTLCDDDKSLAALGLGGLTNGLKPIESCAAYSTIANDGVYNHPTTITKIVDSSGKTIYDISQNETKNVFDEGTAFLMKDILRTAVSSGTGSRARIYSNNSTIPVAGKTGTTTANYDAWFCGFTPYYTAVVWVGNDYNIQLSNGSGAAAALWSTVMTKVHEGLPAKTFIQPDSVARGADYYVIGRDTVAGKSEKIETVTICTESGLLAVEGCPHTETISVESGRTIPTEYCNIHFAGETEDPADEDNPDGAITNPDEQNPGDNGNNGNNGNNGSGTQPQPQHKPEDDYITIPQ